MPLTPASSASAYCTAEEFLERFDVRWVGDLLSDTGQKLTPPDVKTSTLLTSLLKEASGDVEAACFAGKRYDKDDLAALTGNSVQMLRGIVAGLTAFYLWERRPERRGEMPKRCEIALQKLQALRNGDRIFAFTESAEAGKDSPVVLPATTLVSRTTRYFGQLDI